MPDANDAVNASKECSPMQIGVSGLDLADLIQGLTQLANALVQQSEAISQLAMSNVALADAVTSQPEEDEEQGSGYL